VASAVNEDAATRAYIKTLGESIENAKRELAKARRWPWSRKHVPRLLRDIASTTLVMGVNYCVLKETAKTKEAFHSVGLVARELFEQSEAVYLGYDDVQLVGATISIDDWETAESLADSALRRPLGSHRAAHVNGPHMASRALLGWLRSRPDVVEESSAIATEIDKGQFALWGALARCAIRKDVAEFNAQLKSLAKFVRTQVMRGDFKYSEDRFAYLPGQLILRLAQRDGLDVQLPPEPYWQPCPER
jgi:hypothetical protein